jgi:hypothetical protein
MFFFYWIIPDLIKIKLFCLSMGIAWIVGSFGKRRISVEGYLWHGWFGANFIPCVLWQANKNWRSIGLIPIF